MLALNIICSHLGGDRNKYFLIMAENYINELSWAKKNSLSMPNDHWNKKDSNLLLVHIYNCMCIFIWNTKSSITSITLPNTLEFVSYRIQAANINLIPNIESIEILILKQHDWVYNQVSDWFVGWRKKWNKYLKDFWIELHLDSNIIGPNN